MITYDLSEKRARQNPVNLPSLRRFVKRARTAVPLAGEVFVLLTSDAAIRKLNRNFRGKNKPTDVLSFPASTSPQNIAGDLAISVDTAAQQAKQFRHPLQVELKILLLHGMLHLAGFDHEADAGEMATREEEMRRRFRLPVALISREKGSRKASWRPSGSRATAQIGGARR
jgi:probable rRNA maturation factor